MKFEPLPSTCVLELIPTRRFTEVRPLINALILNMLALSPLSPAQAVKVASLTKLSADPAV